MNQGERNRKWTRTEVNRLTELWATGLTTEKIAQLMGRTIGSVHGMSRRQGLPPRDHQGRPTTIRTAIWALWIDGEMREVVDGCASCGTHLMSARKAPKQLCTFCSTPRCWFGTERERRALHEHAMDSRRRKATG